MTESLPIDKFQYLPPWIRIESKGGLERELQKEISNEHYLSKKVVIAIAKREDNDDVLFQISTGGFALVHLTWSAFQESNVYFPRTTIYNEWSDVYEKVIMKDHVEYQD